MAERDSRDHRCQFKHSKGKTVPWLKNVKAEYSGGKFMNQIDGAKKRYVETPIPEELSGRIQGAIVQFEVLKKCR